MTTNLRTFFGTKQVNDCPCVCFNCGKFFFLNKKLLRHPHKRHLCLACGTRQVELEDYYRKRRDEK